MLRLTLACVLLTAAAAAGDWMTGGGNPWRSGLSDERGPESREDVAWQGTESGWFGTPIFISEGKLVTMRFQSIDYAPVVCHDLETGETLWTHDFPGANSRSVPIGFRDGRVFAVNFQESQHDTLYALDAEDGHVLWRAALRAWMSITESASFADDGDLVVAADSFRLARIDCVTGDRVWVTPRVWPVSGSTDACVYGNTVYAYSGDIGSLYLCAWDLGTGQFRDQVRIEDTHPGGPLPQSAPMVGDDGTIYAHKPGDNVTAIRDFGDSLHVLWSHEVSGDGYHYSIFSHFAVGPDRSVYCTSNGRIQRLDPVTGACLDSSPVLQDPASIYFGTRMAIGADSTVYATVGPENSALYCLTLDLQVLWADSLPNMNTSGPALGNGFLAVSGAGTELRVYHNAVGVAEAPPVVVPRLVVAPNPATRFARVAAGADEGCTVYDLSGKLVRRLGSDRRWDLADDAGMRVSAGVYLVKVQGPTGDRTATLVVD